MDILIGGFAQNDLEELRIYLKNINGRDFVDIRAWTSLKAEDEKIPTGKGIVIDARRWPELKKLIQETENHIIKENG